VELPRGKRLKIDLKKEIKNVARHIYIYSLQIFATHSRTGKPCAQYIQHVVQKDDFQKNVAKEMET